MTTDYLSIFIRALQNTNKSLNISPRSPLFDTLVVPAADLLSTIDVQLNELAANVDYSNFFASDGTIDTEAHYTILKNNLFLGDMTLDKASVSVNFYYANDSYPSEIVIPEGCQITKDTKVFYIIPGTYDTLIWNSATGTSQVYTAFTAYATESGADYNGVLPGVWSANIVVGAVSISSSVSSSGGNDINEKLSQDSLESIVNNRAWDNVNSIAFQLYNNISNFYPNKYSTLRLNNAELESGSYRLGDEHITNGNHSEILCDFGLETQAMDVTDLPVNYDGSSIVDPSLTWYYYDVPSYIPLYSVVSVTSISDTTHSFDFAVDYEIKRIYVQQYSEAKITILTSNNQLMSFINSYMENNVNPNIIGGYFTVRGFYPLTAFLIPNDLDVYQTAALITTTGASAIKAALLAGTSVKSTLAALTLGGFTEDYDRIVANLSAAQTSLQEYLQSTFALASVNYTSISAYIKANTDVKVASVQIRAAGKYVSTTLIETQIAYGSAWGYYTLDDEQGTLPSTAQIYKNGKYIPISDNNTIPVGLNF